MPLSTYNKSLTKLTITLSSDGGGGYTESTATATISGYIWNMTSNEILTSQQLKEDATCYLATNDAVYKGNRITDATTYSESKTYEVVGESNNYPHRYKIYKLKLVAP